MARQCVAAARCGKRTVHPPNTPASPRQAVERASRPRAAVFAINQDYGRAMVELDDGKTLARVVEMSAATLVVLDGEVFALSRLWCLYEIGSTPLHKLELITPGGDAAQAIAAVRLVDAETALWCVRKPP